MSVPFIDVQGEPAIHGFLHVPSRPSGDSVVLSHGAGSDCQSKLLVEISDALADMGFTVLRFDLPFRRARPHGPPSFGSPDRDREGVRRAAVVMREKTRGVLILGGHSYGGRQTSMLVAEEPQLVDGLLLLSYPLHPPRKPKELRTSHFPKLRKPAFFVHGSRDPFGTITEIEDALELIPAEHGLFEVEGAGHDLLSKGNASKGPGDVVKKFQLFLNKNITSSR
jgi:uncharacterized protein